MPTEGEYYMLDCRADEHTRLEHLPEVGDQGWFSGSRFRAVVNTPITVSMLDGYEDRGLLEFFPSRMLMRNDLVECIQKAGVDNLDVYPAIIRDDANGIEYKDYSAVNIVGVVSAADPARTSFWQENRSRLIDADIEGLGIDDTKTNGALMFRLAEAVTGIVVHRSVKDAIEAAGFEQMVFHDPAEWVG